MPLILAFRDRQGHPLPTESQLHESLAILLPDEHARFYIASASGNDCAGYLQQRYRYSLWTQALQADIEDLFVLPAARRQGVGRTLMEFAIENARSAGCRQISVDTRERNIEAMALYEKLGFSAESPSEGRRILLRHRL